MRALAILVLLATSLAALANDRVLVFTKTAGFMHPSITEGVVMLEDFSVEHDFAIEVSSDAALFNPVDLARFDAVVWLSTTGDVLDTSQQEAFEDWIDAGGGYVGIHAAADCEYGWPWYGSAILGNGAWFNSHPSIQTAMLDVEDPADPSTAHLPPRFAFTDEWYNFRANPRPDVQVLVRLDESSYNPGTGAMGADHPISWKHATDNGRVWYTGLGHRSETYADARFRLHVLGGLLWAMRRDDLIFVDGFEL